MQFIYGTGIDKFCDRASQLADRYGAGFAITPKVKDAIVAHQPRY
jgi:3-hydroxyacyl-CoA dehydrogenase/enoyl-CoA hydratase/3-hydroxybutyryl-CoA epimerase